MSVRPISFSVLMRAVPKANMHKVAMRGARRRGVVNDLTGVLAKKEEAFVLQAYESLADDERAMLPFDCPLEAQVVFVYKVAEGWPAWKKKAALAGEFFYVSTPDLENVAKFVFDAMESVFYTDDRLVFRQTLEKRYGPEERVIVTLNPRLQAVK